MSEENFLIVHQIVFTEYYYTFMKLETKCMIKYTIIRQSNNAQFKNIFGHYIQIYNAKYLNTTQATIRT